ncbi:MAG: EFR1 family ferrodoxin [Desulfobulbaceae bacterium]|nr:EFR1 family ferrodoxin [Desulfobulbaceae bacterium]
MKHIIVYFSPAGSTRLIAETIHRRLTEHGQEVVLIDLSTKNRTTVEKTSLVDPPCCLWIGSPVYCDHAVPLVTDFIHRLPFGSSKSYAVPFVTWGGVTSGLSLLEMAGQLQKKNFIPLAAAKVLAVHSSMWCAYQPLASGHPDKEDLSQINLLVDEVLRTLKMEEMVPLDIKVLDYLSLALRADAVSKSLKAVKAAMPPLAVNEQRCLQCGECAEICPVAAITLSPFPILADNCVLCLQCVRSCPQEAFIFNGDTVATRIAAMADHSDEEKVTKIFF